MDRPAAPTLPRSIEPFTIAVEEDVLAVAHFRAQLDGRRLHFVHERGHGPNPRPLVLTHAFPGSFVEYLDLLPLLTDPAAHGGRAEDAFDVVIPSMPGYGFSDPLTEPFLETTVADLWCRLLTDGLGYERFGAHGSDVGVDLLRSFSDTGGDVESGISRRRILENLTVWWVNATIGAAMQGSYDFAHVPQPPPDALIEVPAGFAVFADSYRPDAVRTPRELAEGAFRIERWTEMPRGGHFAALEAPELAEELRAFFRPLRRARG